MKQSIECFLNGAMLVLKKTATVQEAARAMYERKVGSAVVCGKDGRMVGLITDRDLSDQVLAFGYPPDAPISDFMTTDIYTITENSTVSDAIGIMKNYGVRRVPVIRKLESGREKCVGMITLDDLISEESIDLATLSQIVSKQVIRSRRTKITSERKYERSEQTLNRFYNLVADHTGLGRETAESVAFYLLSTIIRRLPPTGAVQMISQLPKNLQEDLLDLRAGPDRSITDETLLSGMMSRFQMTTKESKKVIEHFWDALEAFTATSHEPDQVLAQLPEGMRNLLL